jgi:hypothetical protein
MANGNIGAAERGSQFCLQYDVNHRSQGLADQILSACPSLTAFAPDRFVWKSPLEVERYREYQDDFLGPLGLDRYNGQLRSFWPLGGPVWDALALLEAPNVEGVLLVEAKAYPTEALSECNATATQSIEKIASAFSRVQGFMGIGPDAGVWNTWWNVYYQLANRLAFLYFFNQLIRIPTYLALLYYVNDQAHIPTSLSDWCVHSKSVYAAMGIHADCQLLNRIVTVYPEAPAEE